MPAYEYEDLGNGLARVVDAEGNEQLVTTLPNALEMGIPQVGAAPAVNPNPMDVVDTSQVAQPVTGNPLGIELPDAQAPGGVARSIDPGVDTSSTAQSMQAYGQALQAGGDPAAAAAAAQAAQDRPTARQQPTQPDDASAYTQGYTPRQQAPQGPQYATATTRNKQTSTTKTLGIDEDIKAMDEAGDKAADAIEKRAEAQANAASRIAAIRDTEIEANEKTLAAVQERRQRGAAAVEERMQNLERFKQEYADAVEAGKASYWSDKSTGNKVMATIGLMFGAMGQAYTGQNIAQQLMQVAMDDEYRRERDKVADAGKLMRGEFDMLSAVKSQTSDDVEGMLLERDLKIQGVQSQIRQVADDLGGIEAFPKAQEAIAALEMERAKLQSQMRDRVTTTEQVSSRRVPVSGGGAGLPGNVNVVNPGLWESLKPTEQAKGRAALAAYYDTLKIADRMMQLRKEYGTEALATEAAEEYKSLQNQMVAAQAVLMGSGVLNEGEAERYKKASGGDLSPKWSDAQRVFTLGGIDPTLNAVKSFRNVVEEKANRILPMQYGISTKAAQAAPSGFRPIGGGG